VQAEDKFSSITRWFPWLVFISMMSVTWWLWSHESQNTRKALHSQFDFALHDIVSEVEQRELAYEQVLRGVQGLLSTTDLLDLHAVQHYVDTLQLDANFYGIQAIGVIERVTQNQKNEHITSMHNLGMVNYALYPQGEREFYAPVIQNVPDVVHATNSDILGFDSWTDPLRREAMEKARDSGMPAITSKLILAADDKKTDTPPAFIMYLPLFAHDKAQNTLVQRRENLIGWVYASFHMNDFMASLYGKQQSGLSVAIYDGIQPNDTSLMYQTANAASQLLASQHDGLSGREYMVVAGHTWTLLLNTQPEFEQRIGSNIAIILAIFGVCLSVTLSLLVRFMVVGRARALKLAREMTLELRHMAQHDHLTGLPNRTLFSDCVKQTLFDASRLQSQVAFIFIDLDKFKPINDSYGHSVGDELLKQVAVRLRDCVRVSDIVSRIGGDEFVILLGNITETAVSDVIAEKVRQSIAMPFSVNSQVLSISCSIGIAIYPQDGTDQSTLTHKADQAMYWAKAHGRNTVKQAAEVA
jgi:diguanylate cyclase (GGDEF)-like protein